MTSDQVRVSGVGAGIARPAGRRVRMGLVAALPVALGAALVLQAATVGAPSAGGEPTPLQYLPGIFFPWMLYGLLAPAVYLLVERAPLERDVLGRSLGLHALGAVAFCLVHVALATSLHLLVYRPADLTWTTFYGNNFGSLIVASLTQYVLLVGASHALVFHARLQERHLATLRLENHLAEARLQALTRQLEPHFLFNALNTVSALASRGETEAVRSVVDDLAELLRLTLAEDAPLVPLARELEWLERYLGIQRNRFGNRLEVDLHVPWEVGDAMVPRFVLQPLIENCVKHGLSRRSGRLRVAVRAREADGSLVIEVVDDGPGFPDPSSGPAPGVGLENLRQRLRQLYGRDHSLTLGSSESGGASVEVRVPLERHAARSSRRRAPESVQT